MQNNTHHQLFSRIFRTCFRVIGVVVIGCCLFFVPRVSIAQDTPAQPQSGQQEQVSLQPVVSQEAPLAQRSSAPPVKFDSQKGSEFVGTLFPRTSALPSLNLYAAGLKRNKPRPIEALLRGITTTPNIQGSIYQSMTIEDYSPISRGMYYGAPYYMRAQASTNLLMPTLLYVYNYLHE